MLAPTSDFLGNLSLIFYLTEAYIMNNYYPNPLSIKVTSDYSSFS